LASIANFTVRHFQLSLQYLVEELYVAAAEAKVVVFGEESGDFFIICFIGHDIPDN